MMGARLLSSTGGFVVDSADFDGTNDYMTRGGGLTGAADSKLFTLSLFFRLDGGDGALQLLFSSTVTLGLNVPTFAIGRTAGNVIQVSGDNAAGSLILDIDSGANTYTAGATWHHLLCSCNMASSANSFLYIDDVSVRNDATFTDDTLDFISGDWITGANAIGGNKFNGCLAEVYFAPGQYLDISVEANRRKFATASGAPVNIGSTGALPTGTAAIVYHHLDNDEAVANFALNRGTGGNFSVTGTLTTGSTSPSG